MRAIVFLGAALLCGMTGAKDARPPVLSTEQSDALMSSIRGSFDMTRQPRPFIVLLVLDQQGNRYPSFWCGRNSLGTIRFEGRHDLLEDRNVLEQSGGFTVQLTHTARKIGMEDALPGGAWIAQVREIPFRVTFDRFTGATLQGTRKDGGDRAIGGTLIQFDVSFAGKVSVGDRSAPIAGRATIEFSDSQPIFKLVAKFPLPGRELGLAGAKGEGITATLHTASAPAARTGPAETGLLSGGREE